jgi:putative ABC transport system permease protein
VVAAVALSFVLLIGCGLMIRSFIALQHVDPGYDPANVLTFLLPQPNLDEQPARLAYMRQLRERLGAIPGVRSVAAATPLPLDGGVSNARWGTEEALADPSRFQQATAHFVTPNYFETMRTRLLAGRTFTDADDDPNANRIVIDDQLAAKAFPTGGAVGKRLLARIRTPEAQWYDVIGVVAHQRHEQLTVPGREAMFFSDGYMGSGIASRWIVRTTGDPSRLAPLVRSEVKRVDAMAPIAEMQPMQVLVDKAMAPTRFALVLITLFAIIAVVLAAVGLYGVLTTVVQQRTAEIGLRLAFGAPRMSILQLIVGQGLRLSAIGIVLGVAGAVLLTRVMRTMLVGVRPTDPATFATIAILFIALATVASLVPARRAAGLDPTVALREE